MKRIINVLISLCIIALIFGGSWAIEYYFYLTEFYEPGSKIRPTFNVLAIDDKDKPFSPGNITILEPFRSNTEEYISRFREMHPNYTLTPPAGEYRLSIGGEHRRPIDIKVESNSISDGIEVALDLFTDDYFFFNKYKVKGDKLYPLRSTIVGLGSGFMTLFMIIIGTIVYKIINKIFGIRQKLLKLILKENSRQT